MAFADDWLEYPDLFPARHAGAAWGDVAVHLEMVGGPFLLLGMNETQASAVVDQFIGHASIVTPDPADGCIPVNVFRAPDSDFLPFEPPPGWEYTFDMEHTATSVCLANAEFFSRVDPGVTAHASVWCRFEDERALMAIANVVRVLSVYQVFEQGGLAVHSAAVVDDGEVVLFIGHSGAGKSTVARLAIETGRAVLSDDLNMVFPAGDGFVAERVPFSGELFESLHDDPASRGRYQLSRVVQISKGAENRVEPLDTALAVAALASCSPYVNADSVRSDALLARTAEIVGSIEPMHLTFQQDAAFWAVLARSEATA